MDTSKQATVGTQVGTTTKDMLAPTTTTTEVVNTPASPVTTGNVVTIDSELFARLCDMARAKVDEYRDVQTSNIAEQQGIVQRRQDLTDAYRILESANSTASSKRIQKI